MGLAAFVLALTYRSYRLTTAEDIENDAEDRRVAETAETSGLDITDDDAPVTHPDTDEPDELDALPGREGSR
jgi:multicomponent Na+:H+ antiporter subunit C